MDGKLSVEVEFESLCCNSFAEAVEVEVDCDRGGACCGGPEKEEVWLTWN